MESITSVLLILGIILAGLFVKYVLPTYATKVVEARFNEKLETYKHELAKLTEEGKFNYQRLLSDFNLYSVKKHEHYIEIYNSLIIAHGSVSNLASPLKQVSTYDFFNEEDMYKHLTGIGTPEGRTAELIEIWLKDKRSGTPKIQEHESYLEEWKVEKNIDQFNNTYWSSQLYVSCELKELLKSLIVDLRTLFINSKREYKPVSGNVSGEEYMTMYNENIKLQEKINQNVETVIEKMQNELSVGYYKT